jgi:hypothetical protein
MRQQTADVPLAWQQITPALPQTPMHEAHGVNAANKSSEQIRKKRHQLTRRTAHAR